MSGTAAARIAGSACFHRGWGLNRSRKDISELPALPSAVRFLREPLRDLLARQPVIVVQVHDHRRERQPLAAPLRTAFRDFVEAAKQPSQVLGDQLAVIWRQVVDALVYRTQGAGPAALVEVASEALVAAAGARPNEVRKLPLLIFESCGHEDLPA